MDLVLLDSHEPLSAAVVEKIFTGCRDILSFTFLEIFDRVVGTFLTGSVFLLVIGDFATSLHNYTYIYIHMSSGFKSTLVDLCSDPHSFEGTLLSGGWDHFSDSW